MGIDLIPNKALQPTAPDGATAELILERQLSSKFKGSTGSRAIIDQSSLAYVHRPDPAMLGDAALNRPTELNRLNFYQSSNFHVNHIFEVVVSRRSSQLSKEKIEQSKHTISERKT